MLLSLLFLSLLAFGPAAAVAAPAAATVNMPPSAQLNYSIQARQSGITLSGRARVLWQVDARKYLASTETSAMLLGKILDERSEGAVDSRGLVPFAYTEKRFRKEASTTSFDRNARLIRFGDAQHTQALRGGEQDRASAIWQLISIVRAERKAIKPGATWRFVVAGQRDTDPWTFTVRAKQRISTALGELETVHIVRAPPEDAKERRLDIWLAPSLEWYPVRLRFEDSNGEFIEQFIEGIEKK
ncbi:DUF3108 domain-containing protein [Lacisediminimonas profundi]|uniref:DUF3108 domain-containing protein n=1 Tax=Lacisediminimonas profundi TaxID=2603856 RepID=UPI00124BB01B|nr:DUF3108 domain-containing protein [Lacisediminimonas profundi]